MPPPPQLGVIATYCAHAFFLVTPADGKDHLYTVFLIRRSHSISFTRAQGIPKYKIGFGRGKGWESWGKIG